MIDFNEVWRKVHSGELRLAPAGDGLGDYTEAALASIGVTQEWYSAAKEKFGLDPACGCDARIAWLNSVSDWWRGLTK